MLPEVNLNPVTREDVDRIAGWLSDTEASSRWFGHYACGDPVHRGYEPSIMLESSDSMWEQVFLLDQNRLIFSIYSEETGHIWRMPVAVRWERGWGIITPNRT